MSDMRQLLQGMERKDSVVQAEEREAEADKHKLSGEAATNNIEVRGKNFSTHATGPRNWSVDFYDLRRRRRGSVAGTSVTGKLQKETSPPKPSPLFPHAHNESQETNLPTLAITPSKRGTSPLLNLPRYSHKTRKKEQDTLVPETHHV